MKTVSPVVAMALYFFICVNADADISPGPNPPAPPVPILIPIVNSLTGQVEAAIYGCADVGAPGAVLPQISVCSFEPDIEQPLFDQAEAPIGGSAAETGQALLEPSEIDAVNQYKLEYGKRRFTIAVKCVSFDPDTYLQPIPNCPIYVRYSPDSGGGSHDPSQHDNRPRGALELATFNSANHTPNVLSLYSYTELAGEINNLGGEPPATPVYYQTTTDAAGDYVTFAYVAPEVSGHATFEIGAIPTATQESYPLDISVNVQVSGLNSSTGYTASNGGAWVIVTPAANGDKLHFSQNNFGFPDLIGGLNNIATIYGQIMNTAKLSWPALVVHDMSLPLGGMFDLNGDFYVATSASNGHVAHRRGEEADISIRGLSTLQIGALVASITSSGFLTPEKGQSPQACTPVTGPLPSTGQVNMLCPTKVTHFHVALDQTVMASDFMQSDDES